MARADVTCQDSELTFAATVANLRDVTQKAGARAMATGPTVQGWLLPHLINWVGAQGCDTTSIRNLAGLGDLADPDIRLPESVVEAAWRSAASVTGDPAIGLHVAESLPRGALDLIEYAFRSSATLASGLERLARYGRVM